MHVCMDMRLGPSTSVRIIAKSAFQGVRNKGFHCSPMGLVCYNCALITGTVEGCVT